MKTGIGTHLGRYEIDAEIGRGAMGLVYQAHDPKIDRLVAIKTISLLTQEIEEETEFRQRFFLEAQAAGRLSHPGIVTIFDVGEEPETREPYIVMEFVAGQPLNKILAGNNRKLSLGPALQITQEIAEALNYAHSQGVIHRDIKPANILITLDGHAKIADFGIAKLNQGLMTMPGQVLGSPAYMAPEQLSGETADARSDLFSLGVILYSMLTGFRPFQGNSAATVSFKVVNRDPLPISSFDAEFPAELDRLVSRSIAKDPEQRYQTGMAMAQDIQRLRERHELMNQTAASLTSITDPLDGTGVVKVPTPRPSATPRPQIVPAPQAEIPHQAPPKPPSQVKAAMTRKGKATKGKPRLMPKEMALTAAGVLFLAIAFIGFEAIHSKKTASSSAMPASATEANIKAPASNKAANTSPTLDDTNSTKLTEEPAVRHIPKRKPKAVAKLKTDSVAKVMPVTPLQTVPASTAAAKTDFPLKTPASIQNVKATIPPPSATATLDLQIEYQFAEVEASVWSDNQLIYSQKLYGESKKRALVFKKVEGHEHSSVRIPAGEHRIHVRIQSDDDQYDQSQTIKGNFAASSKSTLAITCDKRGHDHELQLGLE